MPQLNQKVSIDANQEILSSILNRILIPLNITYSEVSNQIVLQKNACSRMLLLNQIINNSLFEILTAGPIIKGKLQMLKEIRCQEQL